MGRRRYLEGRDLLREAHIYHDLQKRADDLRQKLGAQALQLRATIGEIDALLNDFKNSNIGLAGKFLIHGRHSKRREIRSPQK
jgi:hypothetical protein